MELQLEADGLSDVQFVVETSGEGRASMEHGQCDNAKRVAARGKDTVTLLIMMEEISTQPIGVWAGWATGHEAVRLTPVLEFHRDKAQQQAELDLDHAEKEKAKGKLRL